jgi:hypothetical protein
MDEVGAVRDRLGGSHDRGEFGALKQVGEDFLLLVGQVEHGVEDAIGV